LYLTSVIDISQQKKSFTGRRKNTDTRGHDTTFLILSFDVKTLKMKRWNLTEEYFVFTIISQSSEAGNQNLFSRGNQLNFYPVACTINK
jgi:hypothetical protein